MTTDQLKDIYNRRGYEAALKVAQACRDKALIAFVRRLLKRPLMVATRAMRIALARRLKGDRRWGVTLVYRNGRRVGYLGQRDSRAAGYAPAQSGQTLASLPMMKPVARLGSLTETEMTARLAALKNARAVSYGRAA